MNQKVKDLIDEIEKAIAGLKYEGQPKELYDPIAYIMNLGGKRMRPLLTVLAYQLYHATNEKIISSALAVEIFHNFTLMHDDIMDEAPLRRGEATVHEKWNTPTAILSGDVMLVRAYDQIIDCCPAEKLPLILKKFNRCAAEVCEGQQHDMNFEDRDKVEEIEYISMIRQKTAVLLGFSLELGGILAGADDADTQKLYEMGVNVGIGFQLMDDLLDVYADQDKFGKQVGGDIIANKKTYLLIKAKELATGKDKEQLEKWLAKEDFDKEEKVGAIKEIYHRLGIKQLTESKMDQYFQKGLNNLNLIEANQEPKNLLSDFFHYLIKREH